MGNLTFGKTFGEIALKEVNALRTATVTAVSGLHYMYVCMYSGCVSVYVWWVCLYQYYVCVEKLLT